MRRVAVILGCEPGGGNRLPLSDRAAVGLAVRVIGEPFVAYTFRGDAEALNYAAAAGAASADAVSDPKQVAFDLALVGSGGCGAWGDLLPAVLAEQRGAALVLDVLDMELTREALRVVRDLGRGDKEVLLVRGPAVLVISEEAPQRMYVSRYRRSVAAARLSAPPPEAKPVAWAPARRRTRTVGLASRTGGKATDRMNALVGAAGADAAATTDEHLIHADAETCARHLLRYLAHHGFIRQRVTEAPTVAPKSESKATSATATAPTVADRRQRGPRPLQGNRPAIHRRPRPLGLTTAPPLGKLARKPRPLGQTTPSRVRGPFAVRSGESRHA